MLRARLSEEEIKDWLDLPITKHYFNILLQEAVVRREIAAAGGFRRNTVYETGEDYTKAMIMAEVYESCATPILEDLLEDDDETSETSRI